MGSVPVGVPLKPCKHDERVVQQLCGKVKSSLVAPTQLRFLERSITEEPRGLV